jgi:hypothetical protein
LVECLALNPYWISGMRLNSSIMIWSLDFMTLSKILLSTGSRLIGL